MYMGSRKLVLMNLFAGQEERCRRREKGLRDTRGSGRVGRVERVALTCIHYHVRSRWPVGSRPTAHEAQLSAPWGPRGVGWGCMRKAQGGDLGTRSWFTMQYSSNWHNIAKQIKKKKKRFKKKKKKKKKKPHNFFPKTIDTFSCSPVQTWKGPI